MGFVKFPPFLVREEAHMRAITDNNICLNQLNKWSDAHIGHSVQAEWFIEELFGAHFLSIKVQGQDYAEVAAVQAIIESSFQRTKIRDSEMF